MITKKSLGACRIRNKNKSLFYYLSTFFVFLYNSILAMDFTIMKWFLKKDIKIVVLKDEKKSMRYMNGNTHKLKELGDRYRQIYKKDVMIIFNK